MTKRNSLLLVTASLWFIFNTASAQAPSPVTDVLAKLSNEAIAKVRAGHIDLNALIRNDSNDLVVEYINDVPTKFSMATKAAQYAATKKEIRSELSRREYVTLRDYKFLPYSVERISGRASLISLLNNPKVKAVYPNQKLQHQLAESLPLIRQPEAVQSGFSGADTTVAVLDTGVNYTNSAFGSCSAPNTPAGCRVVTSFDV